LNEGFATWVGWLATDYLHPDVRTSGFWSSRPRSQSCHITCIPSTPQLS